MALRVNIAANKHPIRNFAHGDSLTAGTFGISPGTPSWAQRVATYDSTKRCLVIAHDSWRADTVAAEMFPDYYTTPPGACRFFDYIHKGSKPDKLFILAGVNDINQGGVGTGTLTGLQTKWSYMISKCALANVQLYALTLLPLPENDATWWAMDIDDQSGAYTHGGTGAGGTISGIRQEFNAWLKTQMNAATTTTGGYIDCESWMSAGGLDKSGTGCTIPTGGVAINPGHVYSAGPAVTRPAAWCVDYVHMTPAGHDRLAQLIHPYMAAET